MEEHISEGQLESAVMEGNPEKMKGINKGSLPRQNKQHIFDGIDTSFILKDILKITRPDAAPVLPQPLSHHEDLATIVPKTPNTAHTSSKKYRDFSKEQALQVNFIQMRRYLPPMKASVSRKHPVSYNRYLSAETDCRTQVPDQSHGVDFRSPICYSTEPPVRMEYATIEKLTAHIDRVKELMGKGHRVPRLREDRPVLEVLGQGKLTST